MRLPEVRDATVHLEFYGEQRTFKVGIAELEKIQDDTGAGAFVIAEALARCYMVLEQGVGQGATALAILAAGLGPAKVSYVRSTIMHGLIGGGMPAEQVFKLLRRAIDEGGLMALVEYAPLAFQIITGAVQGPKEDPALGEQSGGESPAAPPPRKSRSRTAESGSR